MIARLARSIRYRLGWAVADPALEKGTSAAFVSHYEGRITQCRFLDDPSHYEYPRAQWVLSHVMGGVLLEVGCGDGGMTRLISPLVDRMVALDVSTLSLAELANLQLPNVSIVHALVETFTTDERFDWIVLSEVIEHVRDPRSILRRCFSLLSPSGSLVVTTPNGHWESDEHLHEWSIQSLPNLIAVSAPESFDVTYIRDTSGRRRWLGAIVRAPSVPPAPDSFFNRHATARQRRLHQI